ncbi:21302_t:CDS:1, partial [Gigaspora margarita]
MPNNDTKAKESPPTTKKEVTNKTPNDEGRSHQIDDITTKAKKVTLAMKITTMNDERRVKQRHQRRN